MSILVLVQEVTNSDFSWFRQIDQPILRRIWILKSENFRICHLYKFFQTSAINISYLFLNKTTMDT